MRSLSQLPREPRVRPGRGWGPQVWSQDSHLQSLGVPGRAEGHVLSGPGLMPSSGTCSHRTCHLMRKEKLPKAVETSRLGNQVAQKTTSHLLVSH